MADLAPLTPPPSTLLANLPRAGNIVTTSSNAERTQLIDGFKRFKKECFADRWIFERQWTRIIHYLNGRQWLAPYSRTEGWRDARLARGIPKPVTNKATEIDATIRAMFATADLGVDCRPASRDPRDLVTAGIADDLVPLLHDVHDMTDVMDEFDYWFVNLGTACLHTAWDKSAISGLYRLPWEHCTACQLEVTSDFIAEAGQKCPRCGKSDFTPAVDAQGQPRFDVLSKGSAVTTALSPLEIAFPLIHARWKDIPGLIRLRWRDKRYYEEHAELKKYVEQIRWTRLAGERSLQIFKSIPFQNDLGNAASMAATAGESDGVAEFEWWMRPTPEHPDGLVARFVGDAEPIAIECESEGLPGPLPYHNAAGNPLWTFSLGRYKSVGGRVVGSGIHDTVIQKYDQLNRLDSLVEMIITRTASPQWMVPKGAEVQWLGDSPGLAGLILQWNAQLAGTAGRPERVPGMGPDRSFYQLRQQLLGDIDQLSGVYDVLKGAKPPGVEAFSAMQLLVERGEARFARPFAARGHCYREWAGFALELEREYGPTERTYAVMTPAREYAFKTFKKADLSGAVRMLIEDGTGKPKTALGMRAMVEHLSQLKLLDANNSDQRYAIFRKFGAIDLIPTDDIQVQCALRRQEAFERWMTDGSYKAATAQLTADPAYDVTREFSYPLQWQRWYDPAVARQEFLKWVNGDTLQDLRKQFKGAFDGLLTAHLMEIDLALAQRAQGAIDPGGVVDLTTSPAPGAGATPPAAGAAAPPQPAGSARSMANSNQNSGAVQSLPGGPAMNGNQAPL